MRQYRVTSKDVNPQEDGDCYLSPDDPIHALMPAAQMGGLGSEEALSQYRQLQLPMIQGSNKGQIAREQNIKPGTDAWFKHWFGDKK
jgi:hypothetical protein